ncbi:hypothetical protein JCM6882_006951 [Rhodosporidiobolus microsporus]
MTRNASSSLPALGTKFSSLLEFKLAAFEAAKNGSYRFRIFSAQNNRRCTIVCIGRGSKYILPKDNIKACTCRVRVYKDGAGQFEVRAAESRHTCTLALAGSKEALLAQEDMGERISELRNRIRHANTEEEEESEDEDTSDADSSSSDDDEAAATAPAKGLPRQSTGRTTLNSLAAGKLPLKDPPGPPSDSYLTSSFPTSTRPPLPSRPLFSCLTAFFPSATSNDLSFVSSAFSNAGVTSTADIATLLQLERENMTFFLDDFQVRAGWSAEQRRAVRDLMVEVRRALAEDRQIEEG